jgi:hypothetical protein
MKFWYLIVFVILSCRSLAQNLIPNPSFEDTVNCPDMMGQVSHAKFWYSINATPDYFHSCAIYPQMSVPANNFGFQYPAEGSAYMGLCGYSTNDTTFREALGTFLTAPLIIGERYYVRFKTSLGWNPAQGANAPSNNIGIRFSVDDFLSNSPPIDNYCHIYSTEIISDTINWTVINGSFVADSAYAFVSFSNFFSNYNTDTLHWINSSWYQSYNYLDEICVSPDSVFCETWTQLRNQDKTLKSSVNLYPNPAASFIIADNIPQGCFRVDVIGLNGYYLTKLINDKSVKIDISAYPPGIYCVLFQCTDRILVKKFCKF